MVLLLSYYLYDKKKSNCPCSMGGGGLIQRTDPGVDHKVIGVQWHERTGQIVPGTDWVEAAEANLKNSMEGTIVMLSSERDYNLK